MIKPSLGELIDGRYRQHPRYSGCVAHWLMTEGGGAICRDFSGYSNVGIFHATLTPFWTSGVYGWGLGFNNDAIDISDAAVLNPARVSVTAWVKIDPSTGNNNPFDWAKVISKGQDLSYTLAVRRSTTSNPDFRIWISTVEYHAQASIDTNDNRWHFLAGTYDGAFVRLYVDGVLMASTAATGSVDSSTGSVIRIGQNTADGNNQIRGTLDDIRIYERGLTAGEVASLYTDPFLEFEDEDIIASSFFDFAGQLRRSSTSRILQPYNLCEPFPGAP